MAKARREDWVRELAHFLDQQSKRVYTSRDFTDLLRQHRYELRLPESVGVHRLVDALLKTELKEVDLQRDEDPNAPGKSVYVWRDASPYAVGLALAKGSYLSHASAVYLHALTDQVPKTIYVNREQSPKPAPSGLLSQAAIDRAFQKSPRTSHYSFLSPTARYVLLSGKNTGRLEVSEVRLETGEFVAATKLERTLIDIVVRPAYAGGIFEVMRAYQAAVPRISVNTLLATLKRLDYIYPYHQGIGFLLERAGFRESQVEPVRALGIEWDFYLDYGMQSPAYDPRWRLFYPEGL